MTDPAKLLYASRGVASPEQKGMGIFSKYKVKDFPDLQRILDLPSRDWQQDEMLPHIAPFLEERLAKPPRKDCTSSCACRGKGEMHFFNHQAAFLMETCDFGGGLGVIKVGEGKTLITLVLSKLLGIERSLLLVPAKLIEKTKRDFSKLKRHWHSLPIHIMSYTLLAHDRGMEELKQLQPQLIMVDEGHYLKNKKATCTRRIRRYIKEHKPMYVDLSGTMISRSILEVHHRSQWALGSDLSPLPFEEHTCREMGRAIDEKVKLGKRLAPGALMKLCNEEETKLATQGEYLKAVRKAWGRRFIGTPGIIGTGKDEANLPPLWLEGHTIKLPLHKEFQQLRTLWETPGGEEFSEPPMLWKHARELACGFYYKQDPEPPRDWKQARREWHAFIRETRKWSQRYDTARDVARGCISGELRDVEYKNWQAIRHTFEPNTIPIWVTDSVLKWCEDWAEKNKGIIWVEHVALGEKLAERTGLPYFSNYGVDKKSKAFIEDDSVNGPIIASIEANKEGRNLQYKWERNLITSCPPKGDVLEQTLARTHRRGTEAEQVVADFLFNCAEQWECYVQARKDADLAADLDKQDKKLLVADEIMDRIKVDCLL